MADYIDITVRILGGTDQEQEQETVRRALHGAYSKPTPQRGSRHKAADIVCWKRDSKNIMIHKGRGWDDSTQIPHET